MLEIVAACNDQGTQVPEEERERPMPRFVAHRRIPAPACAVIPSSGTKVPIELQITVSDAVEISAASAGRREAGMGRGSRTFKLRLSPAGMDMLIDAHARVIKATRQLLPWGTTLHVALTHLATVPSEQIVAGLDRINAAELAGDEVHFLGAPSTLSEVAIGILGSAVRAAPGRPRPTMLQIYLLALALLLEAEISAVRAAYFIISG